MDSKSLAVRAVQFTRNHSPESDRQKELVNLPRWKNMATTANLCRPVSPEGEDPSAGCQIEDPISATAARYHAPCTTGRDSRRRHRFLPIRHELRQRRTAGCSLF